MAKSSKLTSAATPVVAPVVAIPVAETKLKLKLSPTQWAIMSYAKEQLRTGTKVSMDAFRQSIAPKLGIKISAVKTQLSGLNRNMKEAGEEPIDWTNFGIIASGRGPTAKRPNQASTLMQLMEQQKSSGVKIPLADFVDLFCKTAGVKKSSWQGAYTHLRENTLKTDSIDWNAWNIVCKRGRQTSDFSDKLLADDELMGLMGLKKPVA
jgi:hypothetical protein